MLFFSVENVPCFKKEEIRIDSDFDSYKNDHSGEADWEKCCGHCSTTRPGTTYGHWKDDDKCKCFAIPGNIEHSKQRLIHAITEAEAATAIAGDDLFDSDDDYITFRCRVVGTGSAPAPCPASAPAPTAGGAWKENTKIGDYDTYLEGSINNEGDRDTCCSKCDAAQSLTITFVTWQDSGNGKCRCYSAPGKLLDMQNKFNFNFVRLF